MSLRLKVATALVWIVAITLLARNVSFAQDIVSQNFVRRPRATAHNKIVVKMKSSPSAASILSVNGAIHNSEYAGTLGSSTMIVYRVSDTNQALAEARQNSNVESAHLVPKIFAAKVPTDDKFSLQWSLLRMKVAGQGQTAWDFIPDLANKTGEIKVAVVDTGTDSTHPDLAGKIATTDVVNCIAPTPVPTGSSSYGCHVDGRGADDNGHGTHVGGIIGAVADNAKAVAGVGYGVKIISIKALDNLGSGDLDDGMNGIKYAADQGANVINLSWGITENEVDEQFLTALQGTIDYAWNKGAIIVAAAGNCGAAPGCNIGTEANPQYVLNPKMYPAASNHVISVAATTKSNSLASYSEHGNWISVAAPGGDSSVECKNDPNCVLSLYPRSLVSTTPGATLKPYYLAYSIGTSMAAPQVSGVAALLFSVIANSDVAARRDAVKSNLENFSDKTISGSGTNWANGLVNACASIYAATHSGAAPPADVCVTSSGGGGGDGGNITPTPFPAGPLCAKTCKDFSSTYTGKERSKGDVNCNGKINGNDFNIIKRQFGKLPKHDKKRNADVVCSENNHDSVMVNLEDFETWRRNATSFVAEPTTAPGGSQGVGDEVEFEEGDD